ncbi:MAG: hypothetical protein AAFY71_06075 [Bacteroidota bacterium]
MKWGYGLLMGLIPFLFISPAHSQHIQRDSISLDFPLPDSQLLSHSFLVPFAEQMTNSEGGLIADSLFYINYDKGILYWNSLPQEDGPFLLSYSYFADPPPKKLSIRTYQNVLDTISREINPDVIIIPRDPASQYFWPEADNIRKSGSLTQGITVGNNRNLGINSGIQLQLEGDLGDGLKIVGAITDNNVPVQPDGSTQQISDFDKVFVRLSKGGISTTIGDYEVYKRSSLFGNFYRNVQGLQANYENKRGKFQISGAVAKGQFHTNSFMGQEGISGPYQLRGRNNELFFLILAGSERVYLNGQLMTRGENYDYVINYNTAELTFTPKHVITNITRIVIDFEYTEQSYNRSLMTAQMEQNFLKDDRLKIKFSYARDADNPAAPFDTTNYQAALEALINAGDQDFVFTTGATLVDPESGLGRYEQRDTLVNGEIQPYFRFTTDSLLAAYRVSFSNVGEGNGHYQLDQTVNGANLFVWVGADSLGNLQGNFEPVRRWALPKLLQVADLQTNFELTDKINFYSEVAVSSNDRNRLSTLDDQDNIDLASRNGIRGKNIKLSDSLTAYFDVNYQYVGERYTNLDRLYQAEYGRKWNFDENQERTTEQLAQYEFGLNLKNELQVRSEGGWRFTGPGNVSQRQVYEVLSSTPKFIQGNMRYTRIQTNQESLNSSSLWNRLEGDVFLPIKRWRLGNVTWIEDRDDRLGDSIQQSSFRFVDLKPYIRSENLKKLQLELSFNYRRDQGLNEGEWLEKSLAYTAYLSGKWVPHRSFSFQPTVAYRVFQAGDSVFRAQGLEDSRVVNVNMKSRFAPQKKWVFANLLYEVNSEQLAERVIRYIQVNPGQGTHVWLDSLFNNDGIPDLQEFQSAVNPLIADYLQVVVPTRELVPTSRLSLSGLIRWDFRNVIKADSQRWKEIFRQTRITSNLRMTQNKSQNSAFSSYLIDITNPFEDSTLVSASYNFRQEISFFQNSLRGDLRFYYLTNQSKLFLATGDEFRGLDYFGSKLRYNLGGGTKNNRSVEVEVRDGGKFVNAPNFAARNYNITFLEIDPQFNLQLNRRIRLSSGYSFASRINRDTIGIEDARVQVHKLIFEGRFNIGDRNNINTQLELVRINQVGEADLAASLELRQGLQPGNNAIWRVFLTLFVLKNVELGITYDGRVSSEIPVVHTGRVQARAFF